MFSTSLNKYLELVSAEIFILCKKLWRVLGPGTVNVSYTY